jgi:enoyl-CoA hydratase/carnithine racemase
VEIDAAGVGRITFNRPKERNALDAAQWDRLGDALETLAGEGTLRCLVVGGRDRAFAAGGDLTSMLAELDAHGAERFRQRIHRCLQALYAFPVPTIAKINGPAIGGGLEIAIACDVRIGARGIRFGMPAARFGMVMARDDFTRLAAIVGVDRARFLTLTAEIVDDAEALGIGLVHRLVDADSLDKTVEGWVNRILDIEPEAASWFRRAAGMIERGEQLGPLQPFENACLERREFRDRVRSFIGR